MQRDDVTPAQKKMLLNDATLTGIYMTGNGRNIIVHKIVLRLLMYMLTFPYLVHSFVDFVCYLFTNPGVRSFLSERISQDPL